MLVWRAVVLNCGRRSETARNDQSRLHRRFKVGRRDDLPRTVQRAGLRVLDGPGEFPFAIGGYYAFYFLGPDDLKFEVVYMASLDRPAV